MDNNALETIKQALYPTYKKLRTGIDMTAGKTIRDLYTHGTPVDPHKIFVMTFQLSLTCNARYIVEELLHRNTRIDVVVCGNGEPLPDFADYPQIRYVRRRTIDQFREQASARVWIDNALNCTWYPMTKKRNQLFIQTWHGSMGLKTIDARNQTARWMKSERFSERYTDVLLSNSEFEDLVFRTTFWPQTPILHTGHARNDMFFDSERMERARLKVYDSFGLTPNVRIALYAPTFRTAAPDGLDESTLDYLHLKDALEHRFGGDWHIVVRSHYRGDIDTAELARSYSFVHDGTAYPDMQELMAAAQVGITDYSSWICDYVLTGRPGFIFAPDLQNYETNDRGFYYPLSSTPFPIATSSNHLAAAVRAFDNAAYQKSVGRFLSTLGCVEDGHAASRAANLIEEVLGADDDINLRTLDSFNTYLCVD